MIMVLALHGAKQRHGDVRRKSSGILQLARNEAEFDYDFSGRENVLAVFHRMV